MPRPRDRHSALGLLPRMEARPRKNGSIAYRYRPVGGKPIALGDDKAAAIRQVAAMLGQESDAGTLRQWWRAYYTSAAWAQLSATSHKDYLKCWKQIDSVLGHCQAAELATPDFAKYVHDERAASPVRANHERALLVNIYKHAIITGRATHNPVKPVPPHTTRPRERAVQPSEIAPLVAWLYQRGGQAIVLALMAEFESIAGSRPGETRTLTTTQIDATHVRIARAKQRGRQVWDKIAISPAITRVLQRAGALRQVPSLYVFANRDGNCYTAASLSSLWQRLMREALAQGIVKQRFTMHDLRAHYVSQHKLRMGTLPDLHRNPNVTANVYDRTHEVERKAL